MSLVKKVQNIIFQQELFGRGDRIILAVSGGPDSVAMLDIFAHLKGKYSLELLIAHVNYDLRGEDSAGDEELVRKLAEKYGMICKVYKVRKVKSSSENNLRDIRYAFFEKLRKENGFNLIAVAHNADDQAETYLMRIIRGAGLQGLASMQFKNGHIIRPLLGVSRKEILSYLKENKLEFHIDKTNLENDFLRNKIRNKLIPYLEKNFNPSIKKTLFNTTLSIASDYDFILKSTERVLAKMQPLSIAKILKMHPALQKQLLRRVIFDIKHGLKDLESSHLEEILKIIKSTKSKNQIVTVVGLKIKRRGDKLEISLNK